MPDRAPAFLDFAATAARRPPAVTEAVVRFLSDVGASPGRGGYGLANEAGRIALRCRMRLAELLRLPGDAGRIALMANATHALNAAIWGTVRPGERIVVTALDHNSVLRPAARLAAERAAEVVLVPAHRDGTLDAELLERALDGARLFCINAASNVLGTCLDVAALCRQARGAGVLTLVDVAQAAGHVECDVASADLVAFTGHKGLLGPPGTGGLWVRAGIEVEPLVTGGTGGNSLEREMPAAMPDRLEAGTLNGAGIAGMLAGVEQLLADGAREGHARLASLKARLHDGLSVVQGVRVLSPLQGSSALPAPLRVGVPIVTVASDVADSATLARRLEREHGVLVRAGLHCAPEAHRLLGTEGTGAVRLSLGWCTTAAEVDRAIEGVAAIVATS
jgi:cysteine desulfurase / selenocysteine lyase